MALRRKRLVGVLGTLALVAAAVAVGVTGVTTASAAPAVKATAKGAATKRTVAKATALKTVAKKSVTAKAATAVPGAAVSISFDDGQLGHYLNAWPVLKKNGYHGTFYVISDGMTWGAPQMNAAQVKELAAAGDEIGNHTRDHSDLSTLSAAQVAAEFADSQAAFAKIGIKPTTCAYPSGIATPETEQIAATYFAACRGTGGGFDTTGTDPYKLQVFYLHSTTTVAEIQTALQQAKAAKSWIIFVHHGVGTVTGDEDITTAMFGSEVAAIKASGIPVLTVAQAHAAHH